MISTRCQRGFKGIQNDDERPTTTTASCPLSSLIDLICEKRQKLDDVPLNTSLVITGSHPVPVEVKSKALFQKIDLKKTHEEENVILPQQVVSLADMGCNIINIIM